MQSKRKLACSLAVLMIINILVFIVVTSLPANAQVYKQGSHGDIVRQIQQRLKNWGYYSGSVDGVYGAKTVEAVKYFQRKNGLTIDGICGTRTLGAIGIYVPAASTAGGGLSNDVELLARLISAEARGEPYIGQVAVGAVVLNRVKHPSFPNSLSGVIYQNGAFSCMNDGQWNQPVSETSRKAAKDALNGWDPSGGAIYYYNPGTATSQWIFSRPVMTRIGLHVFCT